jgi:hypothetical protein
MSDAITNLGGGGLSTPWLANLANSLTYAMSFLTTIFGGPIINKIGIKWACFIAALAMPLHGSAYYVNARYKDDVYLLAASVCSINMLLGIRLTRTVDQRCRSWLPLRGRNNSHAVLPKA